MKAAARPESGEQENLHEERTARPASMPADNNLERIVQMPTWRELLMDLVHSNQIDPWDIDVVEITKKYIEQVKKMTMNDLRIPANLILAAAILLRFKSDMLQLDEPVEQTTLDEFSEHVPMNDIPVLELRGRIPPKRRVTLDELVSAVEEVFSREQERQAPPAVVNIPPAIEIKLAEFNLDEQMIAVQGKLTRQADGEGLVTFSALLDEPTRHAVVYTLLPLLFLAQRGEVTLAQDPFFGEIFIRVMSEKKMGGNRDGNGGKNQAGINTKASGAKSG